MINNLKKQGVWLQEKDSVFARIDMVLDEKDDKVCKANKINKLFLKDWIEHYISDGEITKLLEEPASLKDIIMQEKELPPITFDSVEKSNFNRDIYPAIMSKLLAAIRFRAFPMIQEKMKGDNVSRLAEKDLLDIVDQVDPEDFREELLQLYEINVPEGETAKQLMQKAFIQYATLKPVNPRADGGNSFLEQIHYE